MVSESSEPEEVQNWLDGKISFKTLQGISDAEMDAINHLGYMCLQQGKLEKALAIYEGMVAIDPGNAVYYMAIGCIFLRQGKSDMALAQFSNAITLNPNFAHAYINRAEVYIGLKKLPEAERDLLDALDKISPKDEALSRKIWAFLKVARQR